MAGKKTSGGSLPYGHPFKGGLILFGAGIPEAWKDGFRKKFQGLKPVQPSTSENPGNPSPGTSTNKE